MNQSTAQRSSRVFCVLGVAILLLAAFPGKAADLVDVRIGVHAEYTRIVLETDDRAPCQIESSGSEELVLRLNASSGARVIASQNSAHLASIAVMPADVGFSEIRIALRGPVETEKLVLSAPHRIVLDLRKAEGAGTVPSTLGEPAPPAPLPEPVAIPEPAEAAPAPETVTEAPLEPAPADPLEPASEGAGAAPALPEPDPGAMLAAEEAEEPVPVVPKPLTPSQPVPPQSAAGGGLLDALPAPLDQPLLLGGLVLALILVLALVVSRRRRGAGEEETAAPFAAGEPFSVDEEPGAAQESEDTAPAAPPAEESQESSLFDQPVEAEEPPAEEPSEAPAAEEEEEVAATPPVGGPAAGPDQDLEQRLARLEERLEEAVDAADRLGRQMAAQTEELRVQRAAIARTQRVLRDLTRPGDEATEPVPKT